MKLAKRRVAICQLELMKGAAAAAAVQISKISRFQVQVHLKTPVDRDEKAQ